MSELLNYILDHEEAFQSKSRLASLYSDFRHQAATNPDGFTANVSAWRNALSHAARAGVLPSRDRGQLTMQTGNDLLKALETRQWGRPLALGLVLQDAIARRELIPLSAFVSAQNSIYARGWMDAPRAAIAWALRRVGILSTTASGDQLVSGEFVVMANVEAATTALVTQLTANPPASPLDSVHSISTFTDAFSHLLSPSDRSTTSAHVLSSLDIHLLLTHLSRDRQILSYSPATHTIKLRSDLSTTNISPAEPITERDTTIATLKTLEADLTSQITTLDARVSDFDDRARAAVAGSSSAGKAAALSALRSKKAAQSALSARMQARAQAQEVLNSIEAAVDRVALVRAMEAGAGVLKGLNAEVGGVEGAERVAMRFREEVEVGEDVGEALHSVAKETVDEGEVDEELEALEKEETARKEKDERREKEKQEAQEAKETEARLMQLGVAEEEARQKREEIGRVDEPKPSGPEKAADTPVVEESTELLGRMSLDEPRPEAEREDAVPAD